MSDVLLKNGKWIRAVLLPLLTPKKTQCYSIQSTYDDSNLGVIQWYSPWRGYAFYPNDNCVFESNCLETISEWIKTLNQAHRQKKQEIKP